MRAVCRSGCGKFGCTASDFGKHTPTRTHLQHPQTFFVDDDLKEQTRLDAVVTVVDAKHLVQHLDEVKPEDVVNEAGE